MVMEWSGFWETWKYFRMWWPGTESNRRRQPFQGCALPVTNYTKHSRTLDPRHRSLLPGQDKPYSLMLAAAGGSLSKSGGKCDLPISRCRYHVIHPPALPGCISDRCHPCQGVGSVHMRSRPDTHRYLMQFINRSFCFTTCPRSSRRYSRYCWKRFSSVRNTFNRPDLMRCKTSQTPLCSESMATSRSSPSSL